MGLLTVTELELVISTEKNIYLVSVDVIHSTIIKVVQYVTAQLTSNGNDLSYGFSLFYISSLVVVQYLRITTSTFELL